MTIVARPHPPALPHGELRQVLPDLFFVTGSIQMSGPIRVSRNMTVIREGERLIIVNSVRLDEAGLAALDALGKVTDVIRIAGNHGMDDPFYAERYDAKVWALKGQRYIGGFDPSAPTYFAPHVEIEADTELPIREAVIYRIGSKPPEGMLLLAAHGGVVIGGDCLQNWARSDEYFSWIARPAAWMGGFLKPHNVGPAWFKHTKPPIADMRGILKLTFTNLLPAHGTPVLGDAKELYRPAIDRVAPELSSRPSEAIMDTLDTLTFEVTGRIARITLNRPKRGNGITMNMPRELAACVERANLDPAVHVIALSGNGSGFCGGYDLVDTAERLAFDHDTDAFPEGSPVDPRVQMRNHIPGETWDPVIDFAGMSRNVKGFMSLFHSDKPVVCKVHGFCVAGGTDMALCSDLLVIADDAKIGYPPARVWGSPTTSLWFHRLGLEKAKRLLFTGDCLSGKEAKEWGLAIESAPPDQLDERFENLLARIARMPINQLVMMKLLLNQSVMQQGLQTTQILGTFFDGITRHTREGHAFQQRAAEAGFKQAVRERDEPFGDFGLSTFKG